ncbi:MAG: multicopper oxidase domain-containing protein [Acidobacteria bacterium]|nr:multicopper oxidase domain-containing protein [Acidobacteriota bacterium]MBI3280753.1 multicopper oxidase domain-containing protein [Acidobacteriota bacterium]
MPVSLRLLMSALLTAAFSHLPGQTVRNYYIAAEEVVWDFAPTGLDLVHGGALPSPWAGYTRWKKTRYIEYMDASYRTKKPQPAWLGVLGPIIRAEVGDIVKVHFLNRASGYYGMHPHGFRYDKDSEGAQYAPAGAGAQIAPGSSFTYTWVADEDSGPGPGDPSSLVWWYHSHVNEPQETNLGLLGPIIIVAKGMGRADLTPKDVDQEFVTAFFIFDEDKGKERGLMHSINGYIFGNLRGLAANNGSKVRWYLLGMGNEVDLHTAHWHGKTLRYRSRQTDVVELLPGSMAVADMKADNPGTWLYHCHVADHIDAGMITTYRID